MHVIDRQDELHARRLGRAAREAHVLRRRGPARSRRAEARRPPRLDLAAARARAAGRGTLRARRGIDVRLVEAPTEVEYDLDHVALCTADPGGDGRGICRLRLRAAQPRDGVPRSRSAARTSSSTQGEPGETERPLLNHLAVLVDSAEDHKRDARGARASRSSASSTRRTRYAVFLCGPGPRAHRVRRAQAHLLADVTLRIVAGAGMAGLCAAVRRASSASTPSCYEKGDAAGRLDAALVVRRLAAPRSRRLPARVPGRRPRAAAARRRAARRRRSTGSRARRRGRLARDRQSADDRRAVRPAPARPTRSSRAAGDAPPRRACAGRRREPLLLATGGFAAATASSSREHIAPGGALRRPRQPLVDRRRPRLGLERGAALSPGWTSSTDAQCRAARSGAEDRFVAARAALRPACAGPRRRGRGVLAPMTSPGRRSTSSRRSRAGRTPARGTSLDEDALAQEIRGRTVARWSRPRARRRRGAARQRARSSTFPSAYRYAVHVVAGITHTIGGLRVDPQARVLDGDGAPIDGLCAAGVDAGGIAAGGYASGLASALVLGRAAAETAAAAWHAHLVRPK